MRFIRRLMEIKEMQNEREQIGLWYLHEILKELKGRKKDGKSNRNKKR